jgi:hypothetical protein
LCTVTVKEVSVVHKPLSTATVYIVVAIGDTVILLVVAPVFHEYVPPPVAVNVVLLPRHIELIPLMDATGEGLTITVTLELSVQEPLVTKTLYVVLLKGLTFITEDVAPVFHI